jgi:hypothetical protein
MVAFCPGSHSFYGDVGQVKVAARRDCTTRESERLKQLAQQVTVVTETKNYGQYKVEMRRYLEFSSNNVRIIKSRMIWRNSISVVYDYALDN